MNERTMWLLIRIKDIVETWNIQKVAGREFIQRDMRKFVELMNACTKMLITAYHRHDTPFYETLFETATAACTITSPGQTVDDPFLEERARLLVAAFGVNEPDFYTGLFELAQHALTLTTKDAKVFADGVDRTNV